MGWRLGRKCEGPPQEAKWPLPGLFFCFAALVCVTTEKQREDPQHSRSLFKKGRGSIAQLWALFPPFLQLPRTSHFSPATTFRSLGPGCPGCTLHVLKSIVYIPSVLFWDPSPGHLPSKAISVPLPLSAPSPHVWCVHVSKMRRVQRGGGGDGRKRKRPSYSRLYGCT